jgi:hypothetical protein
VDNPIMNHIRTHRAMALNIKVEQEDDLVRI